VLTALYPLGGIILSTTLPENCSSETVSKTAEPWGALVILQAATEQKLAEVLQAGFTAHL